MKTGRHVLVLLLALISTIIICIPTLYNGFPFIYYDSGYYFVLSVFPQSIDVYFWRPLTYSYFLRFIFNFNQSLTVGVLVQSFAAISFTAFFLKRAMGTIALRDWIALVFIFLTTSFVNLSNFLMTDLFAAFVPLGISTLLIKEKDLKSKMISLVILAFSASTHYINLGVSLLFAPVGYFLYGSRRIRLNLALLAILPIGIILSTNYAQSNRAFVTNTAHVFLFSRLVAMNIVPQFLEQNCPSLQYKLCSKEGRDFHIWETGPGSKIHALGGLSNFESEIKDINFKILSSELGLLYIAKAIMGSVYQFFDIGAPVLPVHSSARLWREIDSVSIRLGQIYLDQPIEELNLDRIYDIYGWVQKIVLFLTAGYLVLMYVFGKLTHTVLLHLKVFLFVYTMNALICGFFTEPMPRYSDRLIWILPLLAWCQWRLQSKQNLERNFAGDRKSATSAESVS